MEVVAGFVLALPVVYFYYHNYAQRYQTLKWINQSGKVPEKVNVVLPVQVLRTTETVEKEFRSLLDQQHGTFVVGLDAEWKPNQIKGQTANPVAILQIACPNKIYIIQLLFLDHGMPNALKEFLSDTRILKTGVGIIMDSKKLKRDYNLQLRGCLELSLLARNLIRFNTESHSCGLKALTKHCVGLTIPKNKSIQLSDWSTNHLSSKQIRYAAADAWSDVSYSNWWQREELEPYIHQWTKPYLDQKHKSLAPSVTNKGRDVKEWRGHDDLSRRKTPLYDGCQMLAPDGSHISYCNKDKVRWYLEKGLAELVTHSEPAIIKLKFTPGGKPGLESYENAEGQLSNTEANRCVICGNSESYQKYYVVPKCYRQYFPKEEKFHCSHDIVLLCPSCHFHCSSKSEEYKAEIAKQYDIPILGKGEPYIFDDDVIKVVAAAKQLLKNKHKMKPKQICERETLLKNYFQCKETTNEIIEKASVLKFKRKNEEYIPHGKGVVDILRREAFEIQRFVVTWRRYFEKEFNPKYLPGYWDPNHEWQEQHGSGIRKAPYF